MAKSRKPNNDALTWFFSCLVNIRYTNPVCPIYNCIRNLYAWFFANFQLPKTLSLVSFFSVGITSNLRHNLLTYCFSSSISCWFCKFCFSISETWFWSINLSDSSSSILLICFFSSLWIVIQFIYKTFRIDFHIILLMFSPGYKPFPQYNFLTHQFFDPCLSWASFSYGCFIYSRNNLVTQYFHIIIM